MGRLDHCHCFGCLDVALGDGVGCVDCPVLWGCEGAGGLGGVCWLAVTRHGVCGCRVVWFRCGCVDLTPSWLAVTGCWPGVLNVGLCRLNIARSRVGVARRGLNRAGRRNGRTKSRCTGHSRRLVRRARTGAVTKTGLATISAVQL